MNTPSVGSRWLVGLMAVAAAIGCGPSIDPAAKADIDRRVALLGGPKAAYRAPTSFTPGPILVGQWTEHKMTDENGQPAFMTYKVVGQENDAFWLEVVQDRYTGHTVSKMLISLGDRMTPQSIVVRAVRMKDKDGHITELQPEMLSFMGGMFRSAVGMLVISWQGQAQEDAAAPAGTFAHCYKVRTDASWGPWASASMSWSHPEVPLSGLVRSVGIDRPTTMELVAFGQAGATSEMP
jgi:hypothetical protein